MKDKPPLCIALQTHKKTLKDTTRFKTLPHHLSVYPSSRQHAHTHTNVRPHTIVSHTHLPAVVYCARMLSHSEPRARTQREDS